MFLTLITFELDVDWIGNTEWKDVYILEAYSEPYEQVQQVNS